LISHADDETFSLVTSSSDGQLMFLANMASKMKHDTALGSRIAEVHNGSSLFTGDAGSGESNTRRWIIENDWLEAIVALPLSMFYNTGIATYVWVLTNRKPENRRGKVQLIDATAWSTPLRRNLGRKNCELSDADIACVLDAYTNFAETEQSKILPNKSFGYWKITVERPLRLAGRLSRDGVEALLFASGEPDLRRRLYDEIGEALFNDFDRKRQLVASCLTSWYEDAGDGQEQLPDRTRRKLLDGTTWARDQRLSSVAEELLGVFGDAIFDDYNELDRLVASAVAQRKLNLSAAERKLLLRSFCWRDDGAAPIVAKRHKDAEANPLYGRFEVRDPGGKISILEYEADSDLRDTEQIPLLEEGGIESYFRREVLPYAPDAWIKPGTCKVGYEINFSRHFYNPPLTRSIEEIRSDVLALERETGGLLAELFSEGSHE
jgi:type I restriction enzyme M protein